MGRKIISVILGALLTMLFVGCEKEECEKNGTGKIQFTNATQGVWADDAILSLDEGERILKPGETHVITAPVGDYGYVSYHSMLFWPTAKSVSVRECDVVYVTKF